METNPNLHEVVITAAIVKDGKYLITRRPLTKKRFPGQWTIPGGKLEVSDYTSRPKDTPDYWYNVLEHTLRREVQEESGLDIDNIVYVTSLAAVYEGKNPGLVISCMADWAAGEVTLQEGETDQYAWVTLDEAKTYDLIDGIYDELALADNLRKGTRTKWKRS